MVSCSSYSSVADCRSACDWLAIGPVIVGLGHTGSESVILSHSDEPLLPLMVYISTKIVETHVNVAHPL